VGKDRQVVSLAHDLSAALEALVSSDETIRTQAEAIFDDPEIWEHFYRLFNAEMSDARLDRSELIERGAPVSLLEARLDPYSWLEAETHDFTVLYGRQGADGRALLELELEETVPISLVFSSEASETIISTTFLFDVDLDEDAGYLRGTTTARCAFRIDATVLLDNPRLESLEVTSIDVRDFSM
jgi:hypothetical protein